MDNNMFKTVTKKKGSIIDKDVASLSSSSPLSFQNSYDEDDVDDDDCLSVDDASSFEGYYDQKKDKGRKPLKSRTLFDDVKVILSKHDRKLVKMEEDVNFMVRWLNEKFGFILKNGSTSPVSVLEEDCDESRYECDQEDYCGDNGESDIDGDADELPDVFSEHCLSITEGLGENYKDYLKTKEFSLSEDEEDSEDDIKEPDVEFLKDNDDRKTAEAKPARNVETASDAGAVSGRKAKTISKRSNKNKVISIPRRIKRKYSSQTIRGPSQCDICGKFLKDQNSLRQHKQIHVDIRPFACPEPECGKSFRRKFHLQTHSLIHKGVKKHQCRYCGRLFLLQKDLVSHERIHTGERPFACPECPKSFNLKSHLVMHSRTHTGEKPYQCDICSKFFSQSNSLRLHKKNLHNKEQSGSQLPSIKQNSTSKRRKANKPSRTTQSNVLSSALALSSTPLPNKLPLYRNQGKIFSSPLNKLTPSQLPPQASLLTIVQHSSSHSQSQQLLPLLSSQQPFEILTMTRPTFNANANSGEQILVPLTQSASTIPAINFSSGPLSLVDGVETTSFINTTTEIIDLTE